jgi:hypothetical protein
VLKYFKLGFFSVSGSFPRNVSIVNAVYVLKNAAIPRKG